MVDGEGGRFPCSTVHLGSRFWWHLEPGLLRLAQGSLRVISAANLEGLGGGKSAGDGEERVTPGEVQVVAIDLDGRMEREGGGRLLPGDAWVAAPFTDVEIPARGGGGGREGRGVPWFGSC